MSRKKAGKEKDGVKRKNAVEYRVMGKNHIFADLCNFFFFNGEQRVDPDKLSDMDPHLLARLTTSDGKPQLVERYRDVSKYFVIGKEDGERGYIIIGVENQTAIDYSMPVRVMTYDAMQYSRQIENVGEKRRRAKNPAEKPANSVEFLSKFKKEDRLTPVVTIVVYFGTKEWDGPTDLHGMIGEGYKDFLPFIPNYKLNLLPLAHLDVSRLNQFRSDLALIALFLKYSKDMDKLMEVVTQDERFKQVDRDTAMLLSEMTKSADKLLKNVEDKEEKVDMCKALVDLEARGRDEGISIGIARGRDEGRIEGINIGESKGRNEARAESLWNLMKIGQMPMEEAMRLLGIPAADRAKYEKLMEGMK